MTRILRPDEPGIVVSPVTVLHAFRYGVGRMTFAQADALDLLRTHWPQIARWRDSIEADLETVVRVHGDRPGTRDCAARAQEALDWIAAQEADQ